MQRRGVRRRRSPGRSARARDGRCRPSSRRAGSIRSRGRSRRWCRSRARRGSARRRRSRAPPGGTRRPARALASTTCPSANVSSTSATSTPRGLDGIVKRIVPLAESSSGPVKTSPLGMLRRPSELIHVRPSTRRRRSVPSASIRISRATASRSTSRRLALRSARATPPPDRAGRGTAPARRTPRSRLAHARLLGERRRRPHRPAPAPRQPGLLDRARGRAAARVIQRGSTPASARVLAGALIVRNASTACASVSSSGANPSSCRVAGVAVEALGQPRRREPQQRPRAALEHRAVQRASSAAAAAARCGDQDLLARARPPGTSRTAARRTRRGSGLTAPPARGSAR